MLTLYGYPKSRSMRALWALEEAALPYEYIVVDLLKGEGRQAPFRDMNASGKVPVLVDGDLILSESGAICHYIAEQASDSGLLPDAATRARAQCLQWCYFVIGELEQPLWTIAKHSSILPENRRAPSVIETAKWEFETAVTVFLKGLKDQRFLVGDHFTIADLMVVHTLNWAANRQFLPTHSAIDAYLTGVTQRPAYLRAHQIESDRLSEGR